MKRRVVFAIQGEGRGHMTQAISLKEYLEKHKYEVVAAIIGTSSRREIPAFIKDRLNIPIHEVQSPNFITDKDNKGLDIKRSIFDNLVILPKYLNNIRELNAHLNTYRPDLVINFYEPLMGLHKMWYPSKFKMINIAHQYLSIHPGFRMPEGFDLERRSLQFFTRLTARNADAMLGLSFYEMEDDVKRKIFVVPPLLRPEIKEIEIKDEGFLLIYLLNKGYRQNIEEWHASNPDIRIHCFTDDPEVDGELHFDDTLHYHSLNGQKFLDKMSKCMALVSTAGFESVCEAMYMGKPALMVPVEGHYEQFVNSRDAHSAGAGVYDSTFNIDKLLEYLKSGRKASGIFKKWADSSEEKMMFHINRVMND